MESHVSTMGSANLKFSQVLLDLVSRTIRSAGTPSPAAQAAIVSASEAPLRDAPPVKTRTPLFAEERDRTPILVRHRWIGCRRPSRLDGNPRTTIPQEPLSAAPLAGPDFEARQCSNSATATRTTAADAAIAAMAIISPISLPFRACAA